MNSLVVLIASSREEKRGGGWIGRGEREGRILSNRERGKGGGGRIKRAVIPEFIISPREI